MAETVKDLETQRDAIDVKIAETELPVIEMVEAYLNGPEVTALVDQLQGFSDQVSQDTMAAGLQGILSSINIARAQMVHRKGVQDRRVDDAKAKADAGKAAQPKS